MNRRDALSVLSGGVTIALFPLRGLAAEAEVDAEIRRVFGNRPISEGRLSLKMPRLAESGNSVPLTLSVKGSLPQNVKVRRACIFANHNPRPLIATVLFGPSAGNATFTTNIRLNGTQDVLAIAELSDQTLWRTHTRVVVTVGACDAMQTRY